MVGQAAAKISSLWEFSLLEYNYCASLACVKTHPHTHKYIYIRRNIVSKIWKATSRSVSGQFLRVSAVAHVIRVTGSTRTTRLRRRSRRSFDTRRPNGRSFMIYIIVLQRRRVRVQNNNLLSFISDDETIIVTILQHSYISNWFVRGVFLNNRIVAESDSFAYPKLQMSWSFYV